MDQPLPSKMQQRSIQRVMLLIATSIAILAQNIGAFIPIESKFRFFHQSNIRVGYSNSIHNVMVNRITKQISSDMNISKILEHQMSNSNNSNEINEYLVKASKLRKEAEELEALMKSKKEGGNENLKVGSTSSEDVIDNGKSNSNKDLVKKSKKVFTSLNSSTWMISYRFASDPISKQDDKDIKPIFYSGKVAIRLKDDGYTELIPSSTDESQSLSLHFQKFWGWDEEISREDGKKYLSFSADVVLPQSDPNYEQGSRCSRFYFNSQVESDPKTGEILLKDGTVTVKRDIEPPGGFWGVFNAGGILAQFRYCGDFLIKPY